MNENIVVLHQGDEHGNNMIIKIRLSSGREIFGFATQNTYGGHWDLGPTWNYLVPSKKTFLVDAGRRGMGTSLLKMMDEAGIHRRDLDFIVVSHGHEDHDGGLYEVSRSTGAEVLAHKTYEKLVQIYPAKAPSKEKEAFPASCWDCRMPESFYGKFCLAYHRERRALKISDIGAMDLEDGISVFHLPGHSPDAMALLIEEEAMLVGDIVLPGITPHPTREETFRFTRDLLPDEYDEAQQVYGLRAYIRSLKRLGEIGRRLPGLLILPAHRLFYENRWNLLDLERRTAELTVHHVKRCSDILSILGTGPKTPKEIAEHYFDEKLLAGYGILLAVNEVLSHCEILAASRDVFFEREGQVTATGNASRFESLIQALE
jgi:glyoxylase-like metal-dependent hydrolase (beta-lactamase superfamily II)